MAEIFDKRPGFARATATFTDNNYTFLTGQDVGASEDNYVLTYDHSTGFISLEPPTGGGGGSLKNPTFTYTGALLTRVDYDNGSFKDLTYDASGKLEQLQFTNGSTLSTKDFLYDAEGKLISISET